MGEWVRFNASTQFGGWTFGPIIYFHTHGDRMKHVLFCLNLGPWFIEMEIGYEPQGEV